MMVSRHGPRTTDHGRCFTLARRSPASSPRVDVAPCGREAGLLLLANGRAAFTLIELLVVMSIMATLMALTAVAISKVISENRYKTSQEIVRRLNVITEQSVRQVLDSANEETLPMWALTAASNDADIARQLYVNARLAQEFPMTYAEALAPGSLAADQTYFQKLNGVTAPGGPTENSTCLHMALTAKTRRGDRTESQFVAEYTKEDARGNKIIYDSWDEPITFVRRTVNDRPVIVIISTGPNRKKGTYTIDATGNVTPSDNDARDNIYSVHVGR